MVRRMVMLRAHHTDEGIVTGGNGAVPMPPAKLSCGMFIWKSDFGGAGSQAAPRSSLKPAHHTTFLILYTQSPACRGMHQ